MSAKSRRTEAALAWLDERVRERQAADQIHDYKVDRVIELAATGMKYAEVAIQVGMRKELVSYYARKYGIKRRAGRPRGSMDPAAPSRQAAAYRAQTGCTLQEAADRFGVSRQAVQQMERAR